MNLQVFLFTPVNISSRNFQTCLIKIFTGLLVIAILFL
jgi:hypothetical protein